MASSCAFYIFVCVCVCVCVCVFVQNTEFVNGAVHCRDNRHIFFFSFQVTFSNVSHFVCKWCAFLKLGCVTNYHMHFYIMRFVCLVN